MTRLQAAVQVAEFDPAVTDELVRLWRASFEFGVGITDPHPIDEQVHHFRTQVVPHNRVRLAWAGSCVFRRSVTARFGIVTAEFGSVTDRFGDVTDGRLVVA